MKSEQITGFIRHAMTLVGGIFVAKGFISEEMMLEGIGILMSVLGFVWSFREKQDAE